MYFGSREDQEPEHASEEDGELAKDPGGVKRVDEGGEQEEVEDKRGVLVGLAQEFRHDKDAKNHAGDQGRDEADDLAGVTQGLVGLLEGRRRYSAAARGAAADAAATAAVGTAAAAAGTGPATSSPTIATITTPRRIWHELGWVDAGNVDVCDLEDVQVEGPQGNEEDAHAGPSYHGVLALLVQPLQHAFHRLTPTDFHGAGLSGVPWEGAHRQVE